jgi:hypothetical protein
MSGIPITKLFVATVTPPTIILTRRYPLPLPFFEKVAVFPDVDTSVREELCPHV